jgi:hypothetical protein
LEILDMQRIGRLRQKPFLLCGDEARDPRKMIIQLDHVSRALLKHWKKGRVRGKGFNRGGRCGIGAFSLWRLHAGYFLRLRRSFRPYRESCRL